MGEIKGLGNLSGSGTTDLKHAEGQVILIDFWATWCPPCQKPMAHNQEMITHNKAKWGDKVKIVGISIDDDLSALRNHVTAKGWTDVTHYWAGAPGCTAD